VRVAQIPSRADLAKTAAEAARVVTRLEAINPFHNDGNAPAIVAQGDADPVQEYEGQGSVTEMAEAALDRTGPWKIQVGAFKDPEAARRLAETAHGKLADLGEGLSIVVDRLSGRGLYRGRLGGIETEDDARLACRVLKRRKLDCLPIAPSNSKLARN
jgi:cell division protein FtsN